MYTAIEIIIPLMKLLKYPAYSSALIAYLYNFESVS
jgi:hypothetical protein